MLWESQHDLQKQGASCTESQFLIAELVLNLSKIPPAAVPPFFACHLKSELTLYQLTDKEVTKMRTWLQRLILWMWELWGLEKQDFQKAEWYESIGNRDDKGLDLTDLRLTCVLFYLPPLLLIEHNKSDPSDTAGTGPDELTGADGWSPNWGAVPHEHGAPWGAVGWWGIRGDRWGCARWV